MKKTIPLAVLSAALGAGCMTSRVTEPPGYVTAVGKTLYDRADGGRPIMLRGVNAGGWLVTENWMCPNKVAGTQTETYESFTARFGKDHSSTLAWKIPWTGEPGGLQSMGLLRVGHN